jgi:hypothetical protein
MPTYTVLKAFTDVNHAKHFVGETISDGSIVTPKLIQARYVDYVPDATPDPDWDARMDVVEADIVLLEAVDVSHEERITTLEAVATDHEERITTLEGIVSTIGA